MTADCDQDAKQTPANRILEQSRRELLAYLRKAAVVVSVATALALKLGTAFGEA
ncbi:MAG: hypothetical protein GY768_18335 [Planctomycetaceae bacterium]|nr:hypothetical protein [Planctomycetaceae bacterium]